MRVTPVAPNLPLLGPWQMNLDHAMNDIMKRLALLLLLVPCLIVLTGWLEACAPRVQEPAVVPPTDLSGVRIGVMREDVEIALGSPLRMKDVGAETTVIYPFDHGRMPAEKPAELETVQDAISALLDPLTSGDPFVDFRRGEVAVTYSLKDVAVFIRLVDRPTEGVGYIDLYLARAKCGDARASWYVADAYRVGNRVTKDLAKAHAWYSIIAFRNAKSPSDVGADTLLGTISPNMTDLQLEEAKSLVAAWPAESCD